MFTVEDCTITLWYSLPSLSQQQPLVQEGSVSTKQQPQPPSSKKRQRSDSAQQQVGLAWWVVPCLVSVGYNWDIIISL
jgi:hypothetical protein